MSADSKEIITTFRFDREKYNCLKSYLKRYSFSLSSLFNNKVDIWLSYFEKGVIPPDLLEVKHE